MTEVSAAIFIKEGTVLLAQRGKQSSLPGYWEFPGGKREAHETIYECLEREIREELLVNCKALKIFAESRYEYEHTAITLIAIIAELLEDNIRLTVHDAYQWIKIADLLTYKLAPADRSIAEALSTASTA